MKFINRSTCTVYTSMSGSLNPGKSSADTGYGKEDLKVLLAKIVKVCSDKLYIRLNDTERQLMDAVMELHKKGMEFKPSDLPEKCIKDPYNRAAVSELARASQNATQKAISEVNKEKSDRNKLVNGETKDESGNIRESNEDILARSGFAEILDENKKIASGKKKLDPITAASPFGEAFKEVSAQNLEEAKKENNPHSDDIAPGSSNVNTPKDGAKEEGAIAPGANASAPAETKATRPGVKMDNLAAQTAKDLEFGVFPDDIKTTAEDNNKTPDHGDAPDKDNAKKKTRGRKPSKKTDKV